MEHFSDVPLELFGPIELEQLQQLMIEDRSSRTYVNARGRRIRQMIGWCVRKQYCTVSALTGIETVPALKKGRTAAVEAQELK
ncbi:MAG: hypothetical protein AAF432_14145, partial [Planctomycetota bacterium]